MGERELRLNDMHCIGFDMDHTIVRYKLPALYKLVYDCMVQYLVEKENYDPALLKCEIKPEYAVKGLLADKVKGTVLKLDEHKNVVKATLGFRVLSKEETRNLYPSPLTNFHGHHTERFVTAISYFEVPICSMFLQIVDLEEKKSPRSDYSYVMDSLVKSMMYNFAVWRQGIFFESIQKNPQDYIYQAAPSVLSWLAGLKAKGVMLFLITNSFPEYTHVLMNYSYGEKFHQLFDVVVCTANKPAFFKGAEPFLETTSYFATEVAKTVMKIELGIKPMPIYTKGNVTALIEAVERTRLAIQGDGRKPEAIKFCYVGDHMIGDVMTPKAELKWTTVAIVEEIDHFYHTSPFNSEDVKYGDAHHLHHWGSFFFHTNDEEEKFHTFWTQMIKSWADYACISVEDLAAYSAGESVRVDDTSLSPCVILTRKA